MGTVGLNELGSKEWVTDLRDQGGLCEIQGIVRRGGLREERSEEKIAKSFVVHPTNNPLGKNEEI